MAKPPDLSPAEETEYYRDLEVPLHEAAAAAAGAAAETRGRKPIDAPVWRDERQKPPPPPAIPRAEAVKRLVDNGESVDRAIQYVDLFHEYRTATLNIREFGVVAYDPRTYNAMENPYLGRRDRARDALSKMRDIEAPWLWKELAE
jgi:hypothetical protein